MRTIYLSEERERGAFAERAAANFVKNPRFASYSDSGEIKPGEWLALRWGMHNRAVLVLKVGDEMPTIYMDLVPMAATELESTAQVSYGATVQPVQRDAARIEVNPYAVAQMLVKSKVLLPHMASGFSNEIRVLTDLINHYVSTGVIPE